MKNTVITVKMTPKDIKRLYEAYSSKVSSKTPPYANYQLRLEDCVITSYKSGKTVFQGEGAPFYASQFDPSIQETTKTTTNTKAPAIANTFPQAGSDEVGTGDYFGPVCVCCTIVTEENMPLLQQLGVTDSKQITDETIRKIAPTLMKTLPYSFLLVEPLKYNEVHLTNNMNAIKAKLHNKAYINLSKKAALPDFKIIDQFTPEKSYFKYIAKEPEIQRGIHFETKAESKYPAVAAASVIARYGFLTYWDSMEERFCMEFKKGAGSNVDRNANKFVDRFDYDNLKKVAKLHFKNTERIPVDED